jgi:CheY-like chemotaxis protein
VVSSGRAALALLQQGLSFDAIVCDLIMPELTGMELHELERLDAELAWRAVFITGGAYTASARAFAERMGDRVIAKPFDVVTLRAAVAARARR